MKLLLDIGNTRVKWALSDGAGTEPVLKVQAVVHDGDPAVAVRTVWGRLEGIELHAVAIANVTGTAQLAAIQQEIAQHRQCPVLVAASQAEANGWRSAYREPERLGVDRYLMMQALWRRLGQGFIVASAGTALTVDVVDDSGQHLGGIIAPGLAAMLHATLTNTRFATGDIPTNVADPLGIDTESCVFMGALHAATGALTQLRHRYPYPAYLGGGDAQLLLQHSAQDWSLALDLVLDALDTLA